MLLAVSTYFLFHYKSKEILQEIVSKASKGAYRLDAGEVSFYLLNAGIKAKKVKLIAVNNSDGEASLAFDKLEIRLHSIFHLLFRKNLEVQKIELIKPEIITYAKTKKGDTEKHGIPETIQKIQSGILQTIEVLKLEDVKILDASLKIVSKDSLSGSYLYINHINLNLTNIYFDRKIAGSKEGWRFQGALILEKPTIHLPNSRISASVSRLEANVTTRSLTIDTLDLTIKGKESKQQHLKLSTLHISHLNWKRFLQEGIIELDSVRVNRGLADIQLEKKSPSNGNQVAKGTYTGTSFIIHHTFISDIVYRFQATGIDKSNGISSKISLQVDGDSLYLQDFSLIKNRQPAFEVENLKIGLKNFQETDDRGELNITLRALDLDKNSLVLRNYLLETNKANFKKNFIKVNVPEFRLNDYDFEEILQKKLAASSVQLINPEIKIDLRQSKKQSGQKKDIDVIFNGLMQKISDKASLKEISIENGSLTFLTSGKTEDSIKITGLSVVLDAGKFPTITTGHEFLLAIKRFDSKGFEIKGQNMHLVVRDLKLLRNPQGIYFGTIKGNFGKGKAVDLAGVTMLLNEGSDYLHSHDFHAYLLKIERGNVFLDLPEGNKEIQTKNGSPPAIKADKVILDNLVLKVKKGGGLGVSTALNIEGDLMNLYNGQLSWKKLDVYSISSDALFGKTSFKTGEIQIQQPGIISIINANGKTQTKNGQIDFASEKLDLELGLESTNNPSLVIEGITLNKPILNMELGKNASATNNAKAGKPFTKEIVLKKLALQEPTVNLSIQDGTGNLKHQYKSFSGTFLISNIFSGKNSELSIGNISYKTLKPRGEFNKLKISPEALQFSISNVAFNPLTKHYKGHVDSVVVHKISHRMVGKKSDTLDLAADLIGVGDFLYEKGQKLEIEKLLQTAKWWAQNGQIQYNTSQKLIMAKGAYLKGGSTASLAIDSFSILNRASKEEVWNASAYEKGYEAITGGKLMLSGVGIAFSEKKPKLDVQKLSVQNLHFTTEKDKTKLEDTLDYRPLLTGMFTGMALPLKIDSVLLSNARVDAHEISKKTGKRTHIFFNDISGYLKNVKTWDIQERDTLDMRVRAQFYGTDQIRLHFKQSYDDSLQGFWMRVRMSHFNMPEMNPLLTPLMGLKITSGTIDSLLLVVNGNDYFSYGTMDLRYHNLHAKLAKSEDGKGNLLVGIENFFIDLVLRNHDNGRTNLLFKERVRKRSTFNFWAKIGLEGLLTNLGIKRDKKEKKRFESSVERFNLPEKYWDEIDDLNP